MKKIAFCFLIYDIINHEDIWNIFFKNVDKNKYNIYIHYKENTPLKYFDQYKLTECVETSHGTISLILAQNLLLKKALQDKANKHFIFISNSCIPLKNFHYIYNGLNESYSYFNITPQSSCFPRCNKIINMINKKYIQKASQWCILNSKHATLMCENTGYIEWFKNIKAPDEHCYITNIYYHGLEKEIQTTANLSDGATTFTNWPNMTYKYKYPADKKLHIYTTISNEELLHLIKSKSLFGRKFDKTCTLLSNKPYLNTITST